jgi:ketosteroid isomerase-like protein
MPEPSEHLATAIVESQVAAFTRGDVDAVVEHFTEHCVLVVGSDAPPLQGRAAVRAYLERLYRELRCATVQVESIVENGAEVVAEIELRGRLTPDSLEAAAPGVVRHVRARVSVALEEGRIREQRVDPYGLDYVVPRWRRAPSPGRVRHLDRR